MHVHKSDRAWWLRLQLRLRTRKIFCVKISPFKVAKLCLNCCKSAFPLRIVVSRRLISLHILLSSLTKRSLQAEKSLQLNLIRFDAKASLSRQLIAATLFGEEVHRKYHYRSWRTEHKIWWCQARIIGSRLMGEKREVLEQFILMTSHLLMKCASMQQTN